MEIQFMITLATTPQSNTRLLIRGLKLYIASFKHVIGLALLVALLMFIPQFIAIGQKVSLLKVAQMLQWYNLLFFFVDIAAVFVFIALLWRMRCIITNQHESIMDDFKVASTKILLIIGVGIIYTIIVGLVMFFLIMLPAQNFLNNPTVWAINVALAFSFAYFCVIVYILYAFVFTLPLILTEDKGIFAALKKSFYLVWGNWWRVALLLIIPTLVYFIILSIIRNIFGVNLTIQYAEVYDYAALLVLAINILLVALVVPFEGALLLLQLRDLELRKQV